MKKISLILILLLTGCSTLKPVKRCLDVVLKEILSKEQNTAFVRLFGSGSKYAI